jgi:hypothetical protein
MSLEENLSKRIRAIKDIEKLIAQLVYYRDNRQFMNSNNRKVIWSKKENV